MLYSRCLQGWRLAGVMFLCRWPAVFISRKSLNARNSISPPRFWLTGLLVLPPSPRKSCFRSEIAVYGPRERAARRRAKSRSLHSFEEARTRLNYPAASCGVSQQTDVERNCRVGGGAKRRYPPLGMMGIANAQPILRLNCGAASCGESNPR